MSERINIVTRAYSRDDGAFISLTWADQVRFGNDFMNQVPEEFYYPWFQRKIGGILRNPETSIQIACDESDPHWIVGFAVYGPNSIYWIYVRDGFRSQGIAALLIKDRQFKSAKTLMATTKAGHALIEKQGLTYEPL